MKEANEFAKENGMEPFRAISPHYSLAHQINDPWGGGEYPYAIANWEQNWDLVLSQLTLLYPELLYLAKIHISPANNV